MPVEQLCLFPFPRPLLERFGREFFARLPQQPGVYAFRGRDGRFLYVGHSGNLKARLSYYKNVRPEKAPRRMVRLIEETESIALEPISNLLEAQLLEAKWIQEHRPKFNRALTLTPSYLYFATRHHAAGLEVRLVFQVEAVPDGRLLGAFKNQSLCRQAHAAIGRTLWSESHMVESPFDFPPGLTRGKTRGTAWPEGLYAPADAPSSELQQLLEGDSDEFILRTTHQAGKASDSFLRRWFESDALILQEFFALAQRMRALRSFRGSELLAREELDRAALQWRSAVGARAESAAAVQGEGKPPKIGRESRS